MGLFDVLRSKQEVDYEAAAKLAEAQRAVFTDTNIAYPPIIGIGSGGGGGAWSATQQYIEPHTQTISDVGMIAMRMRSNSSGRVRQDAAYPRLFDFIATHRYTDDKVAVFVCNNGSYVVLEDNTDLFPSDALITQLRMIQK